MAKFPPTPTRSHHPRYVIGIRVTDAGGLFADAVITVSLVQGNDPPVIIPATFTVLESAPLGVTVGRPSWWDRENNTVSWHIKSGDDSGRFAISSSTGTITLVAPLDFESVPRYFLSVEATDQPAIASSALASIAIITVNVTDVNEAPTLPVPPAATVVENSPVGTVVSSSLAGFDGDAGSVLTYSLVPASHPVFDITPSGVVRVKVAAVNFEVTSTYTLQVRVTDQGGLFADNFLSISVLDVNEAPVLAAAVRAIAENSAVGSTIGAPLGVSDVDAGEVFTWSIVSGAGSTVTIDNGGQLTTIAGVDFETVSVYALVVRVTDKGGLSASTNVTVNVLDVNEAPVFVAGSVATKTVAENSAVWTVVGSAVVATDVDAGQSRTYSIPAGQDVFVIGSTNGSIAVARRVLDFETKSSYALTVVVTDNGVPALTATTTVTIQLVDVNEAPVAGFKSQVLDVDENTAAGTLIGVLPVWDVDAADVGQLTVRFMQANYSVFSLGNTTGELRVLAPLDFESVSSYSFSAVVRDVGGLTDNGTVTVRVNDVNEPPVILPQSRDIAENSPKNAPVGAAIQASDVDAGQLLTFYITGGNSAGIFTINPCSGQITVANPRVNYEALALYVLTVTVTDDGSPRLSATTNITITVLDVNEAPVLSASVFSIVENSAVGALVGVQLSWDQDVPDNASYSIVGGSGSGAFAITANGTLWVRQAVLDFESVPVYDVQIVVVDKGGLNDTRSFTVTIIDVNEAPVVPAQAVTVAENSAVGTAVSAPVAYTDQDQNRVVFGIVGGNGSSLFAVDPVSGTLSVSVAALNFEVAATYTLTVVATDNGVPPLSGQGVVTVRVLDVNEAPTAPGSVSLSVPENSPSGTQVGTSALNATDPDSVSYTRLTWSMTSSGPSAASFFTLNSAGVVSLIAPPNFESQSVFTFVATVTDQGGLSASSAVTVTITNVNERPVLPPSVVRFIYENSPPGSNVLLHDQSQSQPTYSVVGICGIDEDAGQNLVYNLSSARSAFLLSTVRASGLELAENRFCVGTALFVFCCAPHAFRG